jgi:hypothetical protein
MNGEGLLAEAWPSLTRPEQPGGWLEGETTNPFGMIAFAFSRTGSCVVLSPAASAATDNDVAR